MYNLRILLDTFIFSNLTWQTDKHASLKIALTMFTVAACISCSQEYPRPVFLEKSRVADHYLVQWEYKKESFEDLQTYSQPRLYFSWNPDFRESDTYSLWSINLDMTNLVEVATRQELFPQGYTDTQIQIAISPNGRYILYDTLRANSTWTKQIFVFDRKTRKLQFITNTLFPPKATWKNDDVIVYMEENLKGDGPYVFEHNIRTNQRINMTEKSNGRITSGPLYYLEKTNQYVTHWIRNHKDRSEHYTRSVAYFDADTLEQVAQFSGIKPDGISVRTQYGYSEDRECMRIEDKISYRIVSIYNPTQVLYEDGYFRDTSFEYSFLCKPFVGVSAAWSQLLPITKPIDPVKSFTLDKDGDNDFKYFTVNKYPLTDKQP